MTVDRRQLLKGAGFAALAVALDIAGVRSSIADDDIVIASILDQSGGLDVYGTPMTAAVRLAVDQLNEAGGLLGRRIKLITYDTQSNTDLYAQYAQAAALSEKVSMVFGGITSASREIIRPILRKYETPLWYSVLYEGGVCDLNTFINGTSAVQQAEPLVDWGMKEWGKKIYFIGADYNAPRIFAEWNTKFARARGGDVIAKDFYPLDVGEFGPLILKIQAARPDWVSSNLVGGAHIAFYRQWAAAGMLHKIPHASVSFGVGNEHIVLQPEECDGIVTAQNYFQELQTPENQTFVAVFKERYGNEVPYINALVASAYQGVFLWAEGVKKVGSIERTEVIAALRSGIAWRGPSGQLTIDPATNHVIQDIHLAKVGGGIWSVFETVNQVRPSDVIDRCDLTKDPTINEHFMPVF
jgi:branched-chain amino acid transport system substrate-binding protein